MIFNPPYFPPGQEYQYSLEWIVCHVKQLLAYMESNEDWKNKHMDEFRLLSANVAELEKQLTALQNQINNGDFPDTVLQQWAANNMESIVRSIVKFISFGVTRDGYFCAFIPSTWDFITFDTIMDGNSDLFGHLVLRW